MRLLYVLFAFSESQHNIECGVVYSPVLLRLTRHSYFEKTLANFIYDVLLFVAGLTLPILVSLPFVYRKRKRLLNFFGLTKETPNFTVYFSIVDVVPGGSRDLYGAQGFFSGPTVPSYELSIIMPLATLFRNRLLDGLPPTVRKFLGDKGHWSLKHIAPVFSSTKKSPNEIIPGCVFTVGSKYYNSVADYYARTCETFLRMEESDGEVMIRVSKGRRDGDIFRRREGSLEDLVIVEKLHDSTNNSTVFISAGLGPTGTLGGINFILEKWPDLQKEFGNNSFAYCLGFQSIRTDLNAFRKPIEIARFYESY